MNMKVKISKIKPNPKNPRLIKDDRYFKLVKSIKEFPEMLDKRPLVCYTSEEGKYIVLGGNMRLKASKEVGLKELPIILADEWSEEQKNQFIIKDNIGFGEWEWDDLANEWDVEKLEDWGLDLPFSVEEELDVEDDDFNVPDEVKTNIVKGDLIEIGEHRLICGDSTDTEILNKLLKEGKADMVFTDPPYLMNFEGNVHADGSKSFNASHGGIKNDKMSKEDGDNFLDSINSNIKLFCKGAFYIFFYRLGLGQYFSSMERTGLQCRSLIIWEKGNHTLSNSDYMSKYEPIFYGWINDHNFYGGKNGVDVWNIDRTKKNTLHPTMKPLELCEKGINDGSKKNDIVLDLFLGSGSTMVAAHQLKRKCYGMELDEKYCQVIIDRMLKLDESLEVKINGNKYKKDGE